MPRILLLNHYQPPDPAPTGRLLGELATALRSRGWEVELISGSAANYRSSTKGKRGKLLGWIRAHALLVLRGLKAGPCDVVLCLTDPPFLLLTARVVATFHRAKFVHWVMDLYPDLAVELDEFPRSLGAILGQAMKSTYGSCDAIVGLDGAMADRLRPHVSIAPAVVAPWVQQSLDPLLEAGYEIRRPANNSDRLVWLYSGNLGRSHEFKPLLRIQAELESRGVPATLVFQGRGAAIPMAQDFAEELGVVHCEFRDYAPEDQFVSSLLEADLLVATLRKELGGMLWPSKLALMRKLDRPILWIGPRGDLADEMESRNPASLGILPEQWAVAPDWISSLSKQNQTLSGPGIQLDSITNEREKSQSSLCELLAGLLPLGPR